MEIGGLGKTAVTQLVYNDETVKNHFDLRIWMCISDIFYHKAMLEKIIAFVAYREFSKHDLNKLQEVHHQKIDRKKYLLVLDDVWIENCDEWLKLETLLRNSAGGSNIIVATRSERVARGLSKGQSWSLFILMAFEQGVEPRSSRLVEIGKDIVEKCVGVPLAIRTVGRLLYCNKIEAYRLPFRQEELSKIKQEGNHILPILELSYNHIPSHLHQCFSYCALFPKYY